MNFWNKFCGLFALLLLTCAVSPAQNLTIPASDATFLLRNKLNDPGIPIRFPSFFIGGTKHKNVQPTVPPDFYACNIGFFCRKELLIEKAIKIPLRFRLGSLQQCNYYEGKKE